MRFAAQFYTLRDFTQTKEGFIDALNRVAEMGYEGVQLSAVGCMNGENPEVTAEEAAKLISSRGLVCCATHRAWERFRDHFEEEVEFHHTLHCPFTACGMPPHEVSVGGTDAFRTWIAEVQPVAERLAEQNIHLGYHNHALEFVKDSQGIRPFDLLIQAEWYPLEIDTYWVHIAGMDVAELIELVPGRLPFVHLKDVIPDPWAPTMAAIGEGNLNWVRLLPLLEESGTDWAIVEQDTCPRDPFDCLASSLAYLRALGY
ncbi:MAG: sugar phosphate isomerase/epimerase [Fimbriimonadaceae bacterium]|jgi:sugar phosphate isomerase/epimerase|nr:sugar phosphate isomerase/epimerase [Fimbriimonadaceae bacterium]